MDSIKKWKNNDVINYLKQIKLEILCSKFEEHNINGKDLLMLTNDDLRFDIDIKNLHIRKKLLRHIDKLRRSSIDYVFVKVMYFSKEAKFKVFDKDKFTLESLLVDCQHCYKLDKVNII